MNKKAFTLVELIVVITILAILGTIAFISLQGYSRDARDSVRTTDLSNISKQLELMLVKAGKVYIPENKVDITASGTVILYQGNMGQDTLNKLRVYNGGLDPVDQTPYTYSTTKNLKQYELMGFLENGNKVALVFPQANAATNLKDRFPYVKGNNIGILLDSVTKEPIQNTGTGVDLIANSGGTYDILISNNSLLTLSGSQILTIYSTLNKNLSSIDPSLVGYWDMETLSGIMLKDLSMYGKNLSCYNSGILVNCNNFIEGNAMNLAVNKYLETNYLVWDKNINEFTFMAKVNLNNLDGGTVLGQVGNQGWYENNTFRMYSTAFVSDNYPPSGGAFIKNISFNKNKYYNIILKRKLLKGYYYINGVIVDSTNNLEIFSSSTIISNFIIGAQTYGGTNNFIRAFNGLIDEVRIYNRALSDVEIKQLYESSK